MRPIYPPTIVYSWDIAETFFELDQMRARRLAEGWSPYGEVREVLIKFGPKAGWKKRQTYTRPEHRAVVRPKLSSEPIQSSGEVPHNERRARERPALLGPMLKTAPAEA